MKDDTYAEEIKEELHRIDQAQAPLLKRIAELEATCEKWSVRFYTERVPLERAEQAEAQVAVLVEAGEAALDFAWDELTETDADDNARAISHWCGFIHEPETGRCQTCEGIGDLQKLRDVLANLRPAAKPNAS